MITCDTTRIDQTTCSTGCGYLPCASTNCPRLTGNTVEYSKSVEQPINRHERRKAAKLRRRW